MEVNLAAELRCALELAKQAGELLLKMRSSDLQVQSKSAQRDLVTAADSAAEKLILDGLGEQFPEDALLAEESGEYGESTDCKRKWCIDPLDGTVNYVQGLPMFSVSIALLIDSQPVVGVVYLPVLDECFSAVVGQGAVLNNKAILVSDKSNLRDSVLATGFPYRRNQLADNNLENFNRLFLKQRGIRRMGSAAIDLAYVASGRLDAYWELHLSPWDCAAGGLLVREAGGICETIVVGKNCIFAKNLVAGPATLCRQLRQELLLGRDDSYPPLGDLSPEQQS